MSVADPGLFFLDTNILVYSFDSSSPQKQRIALDLIEQALSSRRGVISSQIVQEFLNVALGKFARPMTVSEAREYLHTILMPLCQHYPSLADYDQALLVKETSGYSFYDALVVSAAAVMGCQTLYSEDLQTGRSINGVRILNPFASV